MSTVATTACTRFTKRCEHATDYGWPMSPCCRQHVRGMTAHVVTALAAAKVTFWADYGTLLGAVRNPMTTWADYPWLEPGTEPIAPGIIPHDKDSDFCVMFTDWNSAWRALRRLAMEQRYDLVPRPARGTMKVRLSRVNHTNVDLFFWRVKENGIMHRLTYAQVDAYKGKHFPKDFLFPLSKVQWEGLTLPAPRDPEAFLEMRYGENWRTPVMANHDGVKR